MKKIKLNENLGKKTSIDEYILDPTEKYVINIVEEMGFQMATMRAFQIMGLLLHLRITMRGYLKMVLM